MTKAQSTLAVLILWALCLPWCVCIALYWLAHIALRRTQYFLGWCFIRFMACTDPNGGGA